MLTDVIQPAKYPSLTCPPTVSHQSPLRLIRSSARPARWMGDPCWQVS